MKVFVIHYPKLVERRERLEKELRRLGMDDVEWVTHWNKEDPFVERVKEYTKSPLGLGHMSAYIKRCWCYQKMIDENIQEAFLFEDDVVFSSEFENLEIPKGADYLRLGIGISDQPYSLDIHIVRNPGGGEASYVTQNFAKFFLERLRFEYSHDIIEGASLGYCQGYAALRGIPVCSQFAYETSCETTDGTDRSWVFYTRDYEMLPKFSWEKIMSQCK